MKKLFSLLLALAVLCGAVSVLAEPADTADAPVPLPAAGDVVEGFEVKEIRRFDMIGADLVLFEHQKTGAGLLYIANDDTNRAFQLTFPTRPVDNTGLPHVFEHSTLSGSAKYPSTSLFMNLSMQTYNTYMNAYTTDAMTSYPIASLSEKQLLALADYYTDCCLHPLIMEREDIYRTESWRYEMADMDSPLTLNGTVYSEMTGAYTLARAAMNNANTVTFPGASLTFDYGGKPEAIPDMTWESLKDYHDKYYHPSNCLAFLYGAFEDYTAFLKLLDEAFAGYEKQEFSFTDSGYTRITEPVTTSFAWPVAEGTDTANQTSVWYYIICAGLKEDKDTQRAVDHALTLMNTDGSVLMQNLKKAFPSGTFSAGREVAAPDDAVIFTASNVNPEDAETFRAVVNDSLKQIAQDGFDPVQVDAVLTAQQLNNKLARENGNPVESIIYSMAYDYAVTGDPFEYVKQMEDIGNLRAENENEKLTGAVSAWLTDPALWTLTATYPEPGLKETNDAALAAALEVIRAGMTDEEKQAVVDATNAQETEESNAEMIAALTAVTVADLPEEIQEYRITDETGEDGIRRLNAVAGVDGVGKTALYLDARALPVEDIHYLRLYARLMGHLGTDAHSMEEIEALSERYLMNSTIGVDVYDTADKEDVRVSLIAEWIALDEDLAAGYDLVSEILFRTQFTDYTLLSDRITAQKAYVRNTINATPYLALYSRQEGIGDPRSAYYDYLNYIPYYSFLEDLEKQMAENPEAVAERLHGVQTFLANRSGAAASFAGNEASIAANAPLVDAFFAGMPQEEREYPAYDLPAPQMREGISFDGNIQYNCICGSFKQIGAEPDYAYGVIGTLVQDKLLYPVLRDQMGAYSVFCQMDDDTGMLLISYRDPNLSETFALYDTIPDFLSGLEISQEEIDNYIKSAYSSLAMPDGVLSGAFSAAEHVLHGEPADTKLQKMRAYKSVTPESVKASADFFSKMLANGPRGTVGAIGTLQANSGLFDAILNPFHTEDLTQVSFPDVAEDNEHYAAIRFVFESGMMALREDGSFGPDDPSTVADFLGAVYMLIGGGSADAEACRDTLAQYGIVSSDLDVSAELHDDLFCSVVNALVGSEALTTDTPDAPVVRADLADILSQLAGN